MSQFADLVRDFKTRVDSGKIELDAAADLFVDVIQSLEWDLEDYMTGDFDSFDNYAEYREEEIKIATRLIKGK
jgi:hypothetical protein